jgi:hypothetical protein
MPSQRYVPLSPGVRTVRWARYLPRAPSSASALKTVLALLDLTRSKSTPPLTPPSPVSVARLRLGGSPLRVCCVRPGGSRARFGSTEKNAPITMDDFTCSNMGQLLPNENLPNRFGVRAPLAGHPHPSSYLNAPALSCENPGCHMGDSGTSMGGGRCCGRALGLEVLCRYLWRSCWPAHGDLYPFATLAVPVFWGSRRGTGLLLVFLASWEGGPGYSRSSARAGAPKEEEHRKVPKRPC